MGYADTTLQKYDEAVDDEFERQLLHRSSTVTAQSSMWLCFLVGAILAWALPGDHSLWSALLLLIPAASQVLGQNWLKRQTARARFIELSRTDWFLMTALILAWLAGLAFNYWNGSIAAATGGLVGSLAGGGLALWLGPKAQRKRRMQDIARINAGLDD